MRLIVIALENTLETFATVSKITLEFFLIRKKKHIFRKRQFRYRFDLVYHVLGTPFWLCVVMFVT